MTMRSPSAVTVGKYDYLDIGVHLHARPSDAMAKVLAAYDAGARRFDSAIGGLGGCPFAQDKLVANIPSDKLAEKLEQRDFHTGINLERVAECALIAEKLQEKYGGC